jgi:hypothetical protein
MYKYLLVVSFFFFSFIGKAETIEFSYPDIIVSGIETEVSIVSSSIELPDVLFINGEEIKVDKSNNTIQYVFDSGSEFTIDNFEFNSPETSVIPLWMSILPPLLAIIFALVFKEVIFSLVSGIFVGAAIMGFYAEGFIGIFTGF